MECGCEFKILNPNINKKTGLPSIDIDYYNLRLDCPIAWECFKNTTKGVFQLETQLGHTWSKKLGPEDIEDLAALTAILRPGVLKAQLNGKSLTQHFVDRANLKETADEIDSSITDVLSPTQQILVYQEQTLQIAKTIAGFDLKQADILRRAIGKKIPELMTKVETEFIDGVKKVGIVSEEKGKEIWDMIRKSERYSFNKSHSVAYAYIGYWTAYLKSHFPLLFYSEWLSYAKHKLDGKTEIKDLIRDGKNFNIKVNNPSILHLDANFCISNNEIYFGISNIKGIGESQFEKLKKATEEAGPIDKFKWLDFLLCLFPKLSKTVVTNLILVGGLDHLGYKRQQMIYEYNIINQLTNKELNQLIDSNKDLSLIERMSCIKASKPRTNIINSLIESLKKPNIPLDDNLVWINRTEEDLLGIPLSVTKLETCVDDGEADTTCKEFKDGKGGNLTLSVEIIESKEITIKKGNNSGQKMGFLAVEDSTGYLDNIAIFPSIWDEYKNILYTGNTILIKGYKSKKDSLVLQEAFQI
jgi:DNA polymerase-3 subunit alpha